MRLDAQAMGVYPIAATPFHPDGRIDGRSVDTLVDFYQSAGADGLTILGVLGEAPKIDAAESVCLIRQVVKRARIPVIVGISVSGFAAMRTLAREAMNLGAAGVMIAPSNPLRTDD